MGDQGATPERLGESKPILGQSPQQQERPNPCDLEAVLGRIPEKLCTPLRKTTSTKFWWIRPSIRGRGDHAVDLLIKPDVSTPHRGSQRTVSKRIRSDWVTEGSVP
jgi:hypothetical protein